MYTKNLKCTILDTGTSPGTENMQKDAHLLAELDPNGAPILHLYGWEGPSASHGHFIQLEKHIDTAQAQKLGVSFARRPTGGGIVFHIWDLAFSFLMPASHPLCSQNTLENYAFVNQIVLETVKDFFKLEGTSLIPADAPALGPNCTHFCMARPTIYDVVYRGMKIAGSAQRRTKAGYLHQGTISLTHPDIALLEQLLLSKDEITNAMLSHSFTPVAERSQLETARRELQESLTQKFLAKISSDSL